MADPMDRKDEIPEEENDDLIEMVDETGESQTFELLAAFDLDGAHYLAVSDPIEEEDPESVEVFILKTQQDGEGNDIYVSVEDEEADKAYEYFLTLVEGDGDEAE